MANEIKLRLRDKKTKLSIIIAAVVIAIITIGAIVLLTSNNATAKKVEKQLSLGEKYLSELNYEQAIVAYELAIEIDPKCEDAYLALVEIYIEQGELEKADEILNKAVEAIGSETDGIKNLRKELKKKRNNPKVNPEVISEPTPASVASSGFVSWENAGLDDHVMDWKDANLKEAMHDTTGITGREIMLSDVWELTELWLICKRQI